MRALLLLAALVATACGTARRGAPIVGEHEIEDPTVKRGQIVFYHFCHHCHPGGTQGLGPALNDKPLPEVAIDTQVREGLGAMPAFGDDVISDRELDDLVAYLFWLRDLEPRITLETD